MALAVDGVPLFSAVQSTWNVLEPSVGPALTEAKASGMMVLVKEALANGRLVTESLPSVAGPAADRAVARTRSRWPPPPLSRSPLGSCSDRPTPGNWCRTCWPAMSN